MNNINDRRTLRNHIENWKDFYQLLAVLAALSISAVALWQSSSALRIQRDEFHLRNRPLMDITEVRFAGPSRDRSVLYQQCIEFSLENISDIPATHLEGKAITSLNGQEKVTTVISLGSLAKGQKWAIPLGLTREVYTFATNSAVETTCKVLVTYSGMLNEDPQAFETSCSVEYWPERGIFTLGNKKYR